MALLAVMVGCAQGGHNGNARPGAQAITVGSFAFSESDTVAELYAQAMEAKGITVRRASGLGSREVVEPALEQGAVDMVPEYIGTSLEFLSGGMEAVPSDPDAAYQRLRTVFEPRGVTVLNRASAQNKNGIAVTRQTAARLNLRKVSDLAPVAPTLVFGGPPECPERPFCLVGLRASYGLQFKDFRSLDASGPRTVAALQGSEIDVALLFTTSGSLATGEFTLLDDDRHLQPAENLVPAVRVDALHRNAGLQPVLDGVSAQLTTDDLIALNRRVDVDHVTSRVAAHDWLAAHGLALK
jgi:osmoprotectant transport system substrate-binding protein